ncbi:hypothetical protein AWC32_06310 [Mycobacterium xenopi]|nr:hypothetical protein AWC32_06310 [Mycobacterium xenopi]
MVTSDAQLCAFALAEESISSVELEVDPLDFPNFSGDHLGALEVRRVVIQVLGRCRFGRLLVAASTLSLTGSTEREALDH